ncbi:MAG: alcohol dehydrogenase AdhP [Deltaproteobacteria bacterium]|nr:alcohol dehydrogenase AdhP [Deltaproteobacteria bacterium]
MKAMVVEKLRAPLVPRDLPEPQLRGPNDVIVKVHACGVCHTDLHAAHGDWPVKPKLPLIPGHEGVGVIEKVGKLVTHLKEGDRVGVPWLHTACGLCSACLSGWETLCPNQQMTGYTVDGSYAEKVVADGRYVGKIPDGLDLAEISPHFCAGVTTYKAVKLGGASPDKTVLISGVGGLGHMALQYAKVEGARTIAVDVEEHALALARQLGADETINARSQDVGKAVQKLGGADVVIATAVSTASFRSSFDALKPGGKLVIVGLPPEEMPVSVFDLVLKGISVIGSIVGTRKDLQETLDLAARGLVKCNYTVEPLDAANDIFDRMQAGKIDGRVVMQIA